MFAFVALTAFLVNSAAAQTHVPIPGVDVLSRGFDMLGGVQNNSFSGDPLLPVWAMTYENGQTFTAPWDTTKVYSVPDQLTPTTLDKSDLQIAMAVLDTYHEYITMSRSSFSISASVNVPVPIGNGTQSLSLSAKFDHEAYNYKQSMTTNDTASGFSKYFMALYSLEALPPFLMTISSDFKAEIDHLPPSIKTAADQHAYNQLVQYFGTHTSMMADFGGLFHLSTFVSKIITQQHSDSWTYNQMSLTFHFDMFDLSSGGFHNRSDIHIDSTFKAASHTDIFFKGGDPTKQSNSSVTEWIASVPEVPVYLNNTLMGLDAVVATVDAGKGAALKQTLTSYMLNGKLPSTDGSIADYDAFYLPIMTKAYGAEYAAQHFSSKKNLRGDSA